MSAGHDSIQIKCIKHHVPMNRGVRQARLLQGYSLSAIAPRTSNTSPAPRRFASSTGVLLDIPRLRGVKWLEPGEAITPAELERCEAAQGVRLRQGDILIFRTGHHRRRRELGPWNHDWGASLLCSQARRP
jgi:hypothetical protein